MSGSGGWRLTKVLLVGSAVELVIVVVTFALNFLTDKASPAWQVYLVPAAGVLVAGVRSVLDDVSSRTPSPAGTGYISHGGGVYGRPAAPPPRRGGGIPLVAVLVVLLLLCGGGGLGVTAGVRYLYGWQTGNETGTTVFEGAASGAAGSLQVTVTKIMVTAHFTRVDVTVRNTGSHAATLPLFGNCQLVSSGGAALDADSFRSNWSEQVSPGVVHGGTINFPGKVSPGKATMSFATVFGIGGGDSLVVRNIPVRAP